MSSILAIRGVYFSSGPRGWIQLGGIKLKTVGEIATWLRADETRYATMSTFTEGLKRKYRVTVAQGPDVSRGEATELTLAFEIALSRLQTKEILKEFEEDAITPVMGSFGFTTAAPLTPTTAFPPGYYPVTCPHCGGKPYVYKVYHGVTPYRVQFDCQKGCGTWDEIIPIQAVVPFVQRTMQFHGVTFLPYP